MKTSLPSVALAKRIKDSQEKRVEEHGSTDPLRLEKRRRMASKSVDELKKFAFDLQGEKRALIVEAQNEQKELEVFKKTPAFERYTDEQKAEYERRCQMHARTRRGEILHLDILVHQFNAQADLINVGSLIVDAMTVRMVKTKKSGKRGFYRHTAALSLYDIGSMLDVLCTHLRPDLYPENKDDGWEPEIDDEKSLDGFDPDSDEDEEDKKAKK